MRITRYTDYALRELIYLGLVSLGSDPRKPLKLMSFLYNNPRFEPLNSSFPSDNRPFNERRKGKQKWSIEDQPSRLLREPESKEPRSRSSFVPPAYSSNFPLRDRGQVLPRTSTRNITHHVNQSMADTLILMKRFEETGLDGHGRASSQRLKYQVRSVINR